MAFSKEKASEHASKPIPIKVGFFYGWVIVFVSALGLFFSGPGQTYTNSVFIESYIKDLDMDRTSVSAIYSFATLAAGCLLFVVGKMVDRYGRRTMITLVSLSLGLSCFWNSSVIGPVTLFIGFFTIRFFGQGSMTLIPNTLVPQWFYKYRGRALSFTSMGGLLGAAAFPPLTNWLIDTFSWQIAWRILGMSLILVFAPIAYYLVRNKPEDVGLLPDHSRAPSDQDNNSESFTEISWTLSEAARTKAFWLLLICTGIPSMIYTGITFQLFSILNERDIDRSTTAYVLSVIPLVSFVCSFISGFVVERVKVHSMLGFTFLISILTPFVLFFAHSKSMVFLFALSWGVAQGLMTIPLGIIWANYFGRKHLGSINSITAAATVIGSALGPIPFGWIYDHFGSYNTMLVISMGLWAIGALFAFLAYPPRKK